MSLGDITLIRGSSRRSRPDIKAAFPAVSVAVSDDNASAPPVEPDINRLDVPRHHGFVLTVLPDEPWRTELEDIPLPAVRMGRHHVALVPAYYGDE